mgnify:CR=1 FL=1
MRTELTFRADLASACKRRLSATLLAGLVGLAVFAPALGQSGGAFSFATNKFAVSEKDGFANVVITRNSEFGAMLVDLIVKDGTATNGVDFTLDPATNTVAFAHHQTAVTIVVPVDDNTTTNTATAVNANFSLANPRPALGERPDLVGEIARQNATAQLAIVDEDRELQFNLEKTSYVVAEPPPSPPGSTNVVTIDINVVLVNPPGDTAQGVEVDYRVATGTYTRPGSDFATERADFEPIQQGTLMFGPNDTVMPITITVYGDDLLEFSEDFHVSLMGARGTAPADPADPSGGTLDFSIGPVSEATVTIEFNAADTTPKPAGAIDLTFNPDNDPGTTPPYNTLPGANRPVSSVAHDTNGNVIIVGNFSAYNATTRTRIARVKPDGSLDIEFNPGGGANDFVTSTAVYTNGPLAGSVLVAGGFTSINGTNRNGIARLSAADGSLDLSFDPGTRANRAIHTVALQKDGGILIGGEFTVYNGVPRNRIARLTPTGDVDPAFDPGAGANGTVYAVWPRAADLITITNALTNGVAEMFVRDIDVGATSGFLTLTYNFFAESNNIIVLSGTNILHDSGLAAHEVISTNQAGTLVTNYVPTVVPLPFTTTNGLLRFVVNTMTNAGSNWIFTVSIQPNANMGAYIGGDFTSYGGVPHGRLAFLGNNGAADTNFATAIGLGADDTVYALGIQRGRLVLGGSLQSFNSFPAVGIAALTSDGSFDPAFATGTGAEDGDVYTIAVQGDDHILIGGNFTSFNQTRRTFLARLLPNGPLDTSFLDPAYNQYAGFPNPTGFAPAGVVNSISIDTNGNLVVGGFFSRVGGGEDRDSVHPRNNVARLHGGATPGPGNVDLAQTTFGADENSGALPLVLRRQNGTLGPAAVALQTIDGAALAGADYTPLTNFNVGWAVLGPGQAVGDAADRVQFIALQDDTIIEGNENFQVTLRNPASQLTLGGEYIPAGVALGEISSGRGLIVENDTPPASFSFAAGEFDVNENDVEVPVNVIRGGDLSSSVSVQISTLVNTNAGFATESLDYIGKRETLSFASGQSIKPFILRLNDDNRVEQDEALEIRLSSPSLGAVLGTNPVAFINIVDNDYATGRVSLSGTNFVVAEGNEVVVNVRRAGGNVGVLRVNFSTFNGTATVPFDYMEASGVLQWDSGDTSTRTIVVQTGEDGLVEGDKQFFIRLFGSESLGLRTNAVVTITDDDSIGTFSFNAAEFLADENGTNVVINVIRRGGSADLATVDYSTAPLDAVAGSDYEAVTGTLIFGVGETSQSFIVPILDDSAADGERRLELRLANPQPAGASLGLLTNALLAIVDNESFNIPAGSVETDFLVASGANDAVHGIALHTNGQFYIAGDFTRVNEQARSHLARLNANGTLDQNFGADFAINGPVRALDLQEDGRILIAGVFTQVDSLPVRYLARMTAGGILDNTFNIGSGADNPIFAVKETSAGDGRAILIGGDFSVFNGVQRRGIARVTEDGRADLTFDPGSGVSGRVLVIEEQRDGKILIGGEFTAVNGVPRVNVARLNTDGSLDRSFDAGLGADGSVRSISIQFDDRILLGGLFTSVSGVERRHIARLFPDGTLDTSFDPGAGADGAIYAIGLQADGRIVVTGDFINFDDTPVNRIIRLEPDGSIDTGINFGSGADAFISSVAIQPDRRILIGGGFTRVDGLPRNRLARLYGGRLSGSGKLEFASATFSTTENATNVVVTVRRSGGLEGIVAVEYFSRANTASAAVDYEDVSGSLVFGPGVNSRSFVVPLLDDNLAEPDEFVNLILTNVAGGAILGDQPVGMVRIVSDDSLVGFSDVTYSANEGSAGGPVLVQLTREGGTSRQASVTLAATDGTALQGQDYIALTTNVVISAGDSIANVTLQVLTDDLVEDTEAVVLRLSAPGPNTAIGRAAASLMILDDDVAPGILDVGQVSPVSEGSRTVVVTVTRRSGKTGFVSVQYALRNGTAVAGTDYTSSSGTLFFLDGETLKPVTLPIIDDDTIEGNETFFFELSNPQNGVQIGVGSRTVTILDDDLPSGSLDTSFNPGAGPNGPVQVIKFAHNNRLLIGGAFSAINGVERSGIARLNPGGALDATFSAEPGPNGPVYDIEMDPEGRILLAGDFNVLQGNLLNRVARLNTGGAIDLNFALPLGFNSSVLDAVRQADGKIVLGGIFDLASAARRNRIARINSNGTLDLDFDPGTGANDAVTVVELQGGKILVGGLFTAVNGVQKSGIARLHPDGAVDISFNRGQAGVDGAVYEILLLDDGRIVIGGDFANYNGVSRPGVALLDRDGNLQNQFNPGQGANGPVYALAQQEDGKILVAGDFTAFGSVSRNRIVRLNPNGSVDAAFAPGGGLNGPVVTMLIQPSDGKILVGGGFTLVDNEPRAFIARLNNDKEFNRARVVTFTPVIRSAGRLQLTINSQAGFTYTLESATDLLGAWTRGQSIVAEGATVTFDTPPAGSHRFFRVHRE